MFGIILVVGGALLLAGRLTDLTLGPSAWPLWLIVPGVAMVIGSFAIPPRGGLGLAIPGAILTMLGSVLWVQAATRVVLDLGLRLGADRARPARASACCSTGSCDGTATWPGTACGRRWSASRCSSGLGLFFEGVLSLSGFELANVREILPYAAIGLGVVLVDRVVRRPPGDARRDLTARPAAPRLVTRSRGPGSGSGRPA